MRKVIITLCFLFAAFMAQAGRISGINIQSAGEAILVFMDGEQICTPTETCFIANYSGRHRIALYPAHRTECKRRFVVSGMGVKSRYEHTGYPGR